MKTVALEFIPGDDCFQLINGNPVQTRIRAYKHASHLEVSTVEQNDKPVKKETVVESTVYSTFARPNEPVPASKLGVTKEDLMQKVFGIAPGSSEASGEQATN